MWTHISDVSQWLDSHWRLIPRWVKISFVMFSFLVAVSAYFGLGPWSGISMHAEATTNEGVKLHNTDRLETMVRAIVKDGVEENRRAIESLQDDIREETGKGAEAVQEDRKFLELMAAFQEIRRSMEAFQEENRKAMESLQDDVREGAGEGTEVVREDRKFVELMEAFREENRKILKAIEESHR